MISDFSQQYNLYIRKSIVSLFNVNRKIKKIFFFLLLNHSNCTEPTVAVLHYSGEAERLKQPCEK